MNGSFDETFGWTRSPTIYWQIDMIWKSGKGHENLLDKRQIIFRCSHTYSNFSVFIASYDFIFIGSKYAVAKNIIGIRNKKELIKYFFIILVYFRNYTWNLRNIDPN